MKAIVAFSLTLCSLAACDTVPATAPEPPASVVVIFEKCPVHTSTRRFGEPLSILPETVVDYVDSACVLRSYIPPQAGRDTIIVPAWGGYAEIMHRNQASEDNYYLLEAGDTVLFTYGENHRPRIRSLRSAHNTWLYNISEEDPRALQPETGYSTRTTCTADTYRVMWNMLCDSSQRNHPGRREMVERFTRLCPDLDSLQRVADACEADYAARIDTLEHGGQIVPRYADWLRRKPISRNDPQRDSLVLSSDSLMHYASAQRHTYRLLPPHFTAEDCRRIAADTSLSKHARAATLRYALNRMATNDGGWHVYPTGFVRECNAIYVELTADTTYTPEVVVGRVCSENGYSNDMVLEAPDGKRYNYAEILRAHRGKVIYIDLWASWCTPCRNGMPDARRLRQAYSGKNVVFIYLAVNDTRDKWIGAVDECRTATEGGINYLVVNSKDCRFLEEIENRRIPQFLLYDRDGKLRDTDAPRAGDPKIRTMIDRLLQE